MVREAAATAIVFNLSSVSLVQGRSGLLSSFRNSAAIERAPCGSLERSCRRLCSSRREYVKMPVEPAGNYVAVLADAAGVGQECQGRIHQIVQGDQPAILVQGSMTAPTGCRVTARNVSFVVEAGGRQGDLFKGVPTENEITGRGRAGNLAAIVDERIHNRLPRDRAQIAHVALGIQKEM